jgi:hypothetical protein
VTLNDFQRGLFALLDDFSALAAASPSVFAAPLRVWLERALQLAPRPYRSAAEAQEALHELPVPSGPPGTAAAPALQLPRSYSDHGDAAEVRGLPPVSRLEARGPLQPPVRLELPGQPAVPSAVVPAVVPEPTIFSASLQKPEARSRWKRSYTVTIAVTLGLIALVEGAIIATLNTQPAVVSVTEPVVATSSRPTIDAPPVQGAAVVSAVDASGRPAEDATLAALTQAAARPRSGGIRWSSPINLNVIEDDRVLGSTADGAIVMSAGTHQVDLVNTAFGYRTRQTVTVRAGVITPLALSTPAGRININAQPWAQVLIDDSPIGETPLANISLPLGQHQITFRHPQLGERRETVIVRADTTARVTVTFDR